MPYHIERCVNGFIVEVTGTDSESDAHMLFSVEKKDGQSDAESERDLLWLLADLLCIQTTKHDKERVRVVIEHGDDYDCTDPACEICRPC